MADPDAPGNRCLELRAEDPYEWVRREIPFAEEKLPVSVLLLDDVRTE